MITLNRNNEEVIQIPDDAKFIKIVCIKGYVFEGTVFKEGEIHEHCRGQYLNRENWDYATEKDLIAYTSKFLNAI